MKRASTRALLLQPLLVLLEIRLSLTLKRARSNVLDHVSARAVLVALVSRQRASANPRVPCGRTPAVPNGWLDVVRSTLPFREEVRSLVFVPAGAAVEAHEVGSGEGEVAEEELATQEETGDGEVG